MSQPYDRSATAECPAVPDSELGEFWVGDPFRINWENNLSSYERNRVFLNAHGTEFLEISHLTAADSDSDARAAVAADVDYDGREDVFVRNVGGGPVQLFRNNFPAGNAVDIALEAKGANRQGIGARVVAIVGKQRFFRDVFPVNTHRSQAPARLHFGIGPATKIDRLEIRWPSGTTSTEIDVPAGGHLTVTEP